MVKFASETEWLYSIVVQHLSLMVKDAPSFIEKRWKNWERSHVVNTTSCANTESHVHKKIKVNGTPELEKDSKNPQQRETPSPPSAPPRTLPSSMPKTTK